MGYAPQCSHDHDVTGGNNFGPRVDVAQDDDVALMANALSRAKGPGYDHGCFGLSQQRCRRHGTGTAGLLGCTECGLSLSHRIAPLTHLPEGHVGLFQDGSERLLFRVGYGAAVDQDCDLSPFEKGAALGQLFAQALAEGREVQVIWK